MAKERPFGNDDAVLRAAERHWQACARADWLEAFSHHPKIGDVESLRVKFQATAHLAAAEQAGVASANETVLAALAVGNRAYESCFGYIFIVCATGKSAAEMLALLSARMGNDEATELLVAAAEQKKITMIRLQRLVGSKP